MERRKFILSSALGTLAVGAMSSCLSKSTETSKTVTSSFDEGVIVHNVYFWLKEGITAPEEKEFLEFVKILKTVPGVQSLQLGKPAPTNPRPVVDNSFSYSIIVSHENMEAINLYENHPIHLDAVEKYKHLWTKVEVRDTLIQII